MSWRDRDGDHVGGGVGADREVGGEGAVEQRVAVELGLRGDVVELRRELGELAVEIAALGVADRARDRLGRQRLHPDQDVGDLLSGTVGHLQHALAVAGVDLGLLESRDVGLELGADGERGGVVRGAHDPRARGQLGQRARGLHVVGAQIAVRGGGGGVGGDGESHRWRSFYLKPGRRGGPVAARLPAGRRPGSGCAQGSWRQRSEGSVKRRRARRGPDLQHTGLCAGRQPSSLSRFCGIWLAWASMATLACITTCLEE